LFAGIGAKLHNCSSLILKNTKLNQLVVDASSLNVELEVFKEDKNVTDL